MYLRVINCISSTCLSQWKSHFNQKRIGVSTCRLSMRNARAASSYINCSTKHQQNSVRFSFLELLFACLYFNWPFRSRHAEILIFLKRSIKQKHVGLPTVIIRKTETKFLVRKFPWPVSHAGDTISFRDTGDSFLKPEARPHTVDTGVPYSEMKLQPSQELQVLREIC
jgi:hypothetical protein